jgi:hypothetical protein
MDPAPLPLADRATDPELGVPVPFACDGTSYGVPGEAASVRVLDRRRVTQCALSRVCGVCGATLGRPLAFVGSPAEADRNAFHFPACHLECAQALLGVLTGLDVPVLGQPGPVEAWVLLTTPAFEFVRPSGTEDDRRPTFQPYEVLTSTR